LNPLLWPSAATIAPIQRPIWPGACLEGDCHFKSGNTKAAKRVTFVKQLLEEIGIEPERLAMATMSAGMGTRFAQIAAEFTETIRQLGPNPVNAARAKQASAGKVA
jgi:F420-non-reducing hydrogenase iron-sulfur subunit